MKIVHTNIVDTVAVSSAIWLLGCFSDVAHLLSLQLYPHPNGLPYRYGLRFLANKYLQRFIQDNSEGHDSIEDAKTSLDLIKLKVAKGMYEGNSVVLLRAAFDLSSVFREPFWM